jgi:ketosteroid isomerase-like protein
MSRLTQLLDAGLQPQVVAILEGEEHVAVLQRNTASANGATLDVQVVNLFTVADGKVARLDTFFGDQRAAEDFWNAALGGGS